MLSNNVRGRFNDILKYDEHHKRWSQTFSNVEEVVAKFRNPSFRLPIAEPTYGLDTFGAHRPSSREPGCLNTGDLGVLLLQATDPK